MHQRSFTAIIKSTKLNGIAWNLPSLIQHHGFHSTPILFKRRGGASAFEVSPRKFSKKQKKRQARFVDRMKAKVDHGKEKMKLEQAKRRWVLPSTKEFIEQTRSMLDESMNQMLVPDGLSQLESKKKKTVNISHPKPGKILHLLKEYKAKLKEIETKNLEAANSILFPENASATASPTVTNRASPAHTSSTSVSTTTSATTAVTVEEENDRLNKKFKVLTNWSLGYSAVEFAKRGLFNKSKEIMSVMKSMNIKSSPETYAGLMKYYRRANMCNESEKLFNEMLADDITPREFNWIELIQAKIYKNGNNRHTMKEGIQEGIKILDRLETNGVSLSISIYNTVFKAIVYQNNKLHKPDDPDDPVKDFWIRMHSIPDVKLDLHSFKIYMYHCSLTGQVERAFFSVDEMRVLKVDPDHKFFAALFRVCAEAPHWVAGYQDTVFDAMRRMEGMEMLPTKEIYNSIIYAFGRYCDPVAAEYYFWEMKDKGFEPDIITYNSFLNGLMRAQLVGAKRFGVHGRWSRPPEPKLSAENQAVADIGPTRMAELMTRHILKEPPSERGKQRRETELIDMVDDDERVKQAYLENLRDEAKRIKRAREIYERKEERLEEKEEANRLLEVEKYKAAVAANTNTKSLLSFPFTKKEIEQEKLKEIALAKTNKKKNTSILPPTPTNPSSSNSKNKNKVNNISNSKEINSREQTTQAAMTDDKIFDVESDDVTTDDLLKHMEGDKELSAIMQQLQQFSNLETDEDIREFSRNLKHAESIASSLPSLDPLSSADAKYKNLDHNTQSDLSADSELFGKSLDSLFSSKQLQAQMNDLKEKEGVSSELTDISTHSGPKPSRGRTVNRRLPRRRSSASASMIDTHDSADMMTADPAHQQEQGDERESSASAGRKSMPVHYIQRPIPEKQEATIKSMIDSLNDELFDLSINDTDIIPEAAVVTTSTVSASSSETSAETSFSASAWPITLLSDSPKNPFVKIYQQTAQSPDGDEHTEESVALFVDPFVKLREQQRELKTGDGVLSPSARNLVNILEGNDESATAVKDDSNQGIGGDRNKRERAPNSLSKLLHNTDDDDSLDIDTDGEANKTSPGSSDDELADYPDEIKGMIRKLKKSDIDTMWHMVEFGRAPSADYSDPLFRRHQRNIEKADQVMTEMRKKEIKPDVSTLTAYMGVYADASKHKQALQIFDEFKSFQIQPTAKSYRVLVRMWLRLKDMNNVQKLKEEMKTKQIKPDSETYGMIIDAYVVRNMVVEALKELEEATEMGVILSEKAIRHLRARCETLGVTHPDIRPDPKQWIKNVKKIRRDTRTAGNRDIQSVRSALFGT